MSGVCVGFSLKNWLEMTMKVNGSTSPLPQYLQHLFFEERGIANLMKDTPCNQATDTLYAGIKVNGWISCECILIVNFVTY